MNDQILKSVIEITRQRDIDSLELGLVTTLAEFVPASTIILYKSLYPARPGMIEESIRLAITENSQRDKSYNWSHNRHKVATNRHIQQCLESARPVRHVSGTGDTHLFYPVILDNKVTGVLSLESHHDLGPYLTLIEALNSIYNNYLVILNESERDKLTGLLNRRTFDFKLDKLLEAQREKQAAYKSSPRIPEQRNSAPASSAWLAMIDIDDFKRINDTYGHLFGDEVILMLSQKMRNFFRNTDLLFRFGGEEFVIILEPTSPAMAKQTFERFSRIIAGYEFPQVGRTTVSTGYARIMENDYPHAILERADKALYFAKENGKNCVFSYDELLANGLLSQQQSRISTELF
jgi:diguanylate cyclase (GGDEF)-like protein